MKKRLFIVFFLIISLYYVNAFFVSIGGLNPNDDIWTNINQTNYTFTAISHINDTFTCGIYLDDVLFGINTTVQNDTQTVIFANETTDGIYSWYINCTDVNATNISATRTLTVDTTSPTVSSLTSPINYENITSNTVNFSFVSYDNLDIVLNYTLFLNDTANATGYTQNNTDTNFTVNIPDGYYNWTIQVVDNATNIVNFSSFYYFRIDSTAPTILINTTTVSSANLGDNVGIATNWTETNIALGAMTCSLYVDDGLNDTISSTGNQCNFTFVLNESNYPTAYFNVTATDIFGNPGSLPVLIPITVVDNIAPVFNETIGNYSIEYGSVFYYDANATDSIALDEYMINDTIYFSIDASTGEINNVSILNLGLYSFNVSVNDTSGNNISQLVFVNVSDTTNPTWNETPENQIVEYGTVLYYKLNASDYFIDAYSVNDTNFLMGASTGILQNNTGLDIGIYSITVSVNDTSGNINSTIITITVQDNIDPSFNETIGAQTLEYSNAFYFDLNATDNYLVDKFRLNDSSNFQIDVDTGELINLTYIVALYKLTVYVNDTSGNEVNQSFSIDAQDNVNPTWNQTPSNLIHEFGDSFSYQVNATDNYQRDTYFINDTTNFILTSGNEGLIENNTLLAVGTYDLNISVNDTSSNFNSTIITVTVQDTTSPSWDITPANQTNQELTDFSYQINATDLSGIDLYYLNQTTNFTINSTTGLITNNTGLVAGNYSINVSVNDTQGNILSKVIYIEAFSVDTTPPTWDTTPSNQTSEYGDTFSYDVDASDNINIGDYSLNDTIYFTINSSGFITNTSLLVVGLYSFNITVNDTSGNNVTQFIYVNVSDNTNPTWNETPQNQNVEYGDGFIYDLNASDASPLDAFTINDLVNFQIDSNTGVIQNNTFLTGVYVLFIYVNDTYGNTNNSMIIVTVQDTTNPTWNDTLVDQTIEIGSPFNYKVNASDLLLDKYSINDTTNFQINSTTGLITNKTGLSGIYSLNISVNDTSSNFNSTVITITVQDSIIPVLSILYPGNNSVISDGNFDINFSVTEANPHSGTFCNYTLYNGTNVKYDWDVDSNEMTNVNDNYNYSVAITNVKNGPYNLTISCKDSTNSTTLTNNISIIDTTDPSITVYAPTTDQTTTSTSISVDLSATTDEYTLCKYSETNQSYAAMSTYVGSGSSYSLTHTKSIQYSSDGSKSYYVICQDVNNRNTTPQLISFSVNVGEDDGGGGGGGGGGSSSAVYTDDLDSGDTIFKMTYGSLGKDDEVFFRPNKELIPVSRIYFVMYNPKAMMTLLVAKLSNKPAQLPDLGNNYGFIEVNSTELTNDDIKGNAVITFNVKKAWVETNTKAKENVYLYKYYGDRWVKLPTKHTSSNADHYIYEAETAGFSLFGIAADPKEDAVVEQEVIEEIAEPDEQIVEPEVEEEIIEPEPKEKIKWNWAPKWIILVVVGIILIGIVIFILKRPKYNKLKDISKSLEKYEVDTDKSEEEEEERNIEELHSFVREAKKRDYTDERIKAELIEAGWPQEIIDEEIK